MSALFGAERLGGFVCTWALFAALAGCAGNDEWTGPAPSPDGAMFVQQVYPLLLRDCAFSECHGAPDRFFQVYGPGRTRLSPLTTKPDDPMTLPELVHSYDRSRSMLATAQSIEHTLLLSKPLETAAGGQGHKGIDDYGRNVFASTADPNYLMLLRWAQTKGTAPTDAQRMAAIAAQTPAGMP